MIHKHKMCKTFIMKTKNSKHKTPWNGEQFKSWKIECIKIISYYKLLLPAVTGHRLLSRARRVQREPVPSVLQRERLDPPPCRHLDLQPLRPAARGRCQSVPGHNKTTSLSALRRKSHSNDSKHSRLTSLGGGPSTVIETRFSPRSKTRPSTLFSSRSGCLEFLGLRKTRID